MVVFLLFGALIRPCIPARWTDCIICLRFVFSVYRWKKSSNKNATSVLNLDYILLTKAQIRKIKAIYYLQLLKLKVIKCHYFSIRVLTAELWPFFVIFKENQVFAQFLLHKQIELPKMGLHTKKQVSISKNKKMAAVLKSPSVIWPEEFRQYFAFFTSSH